MGLFVIAIPRPGAPDLAPDHRLNLRFLLPLSFREVSSPLAAQVQNALIEQSGLFKIALYDGAFTDQFEEMSNVQRIDALTPCFRALCRKQFVDMSLAGTVISCDCSHSQEIVLFGLGIGGKRVCLIRGQFGIVGDLLWLAAPFAQMMRDRRRRLLFAPPVGLHERFCSAPMQLRAPRA